MEEAVRKRKSEEMKRSEKEGWIGEEFQARRKSIPYRKETSPQMSAETNYVLLYEYRSEYHIFLVE
jgi:hypothetical protein